jgi:hypothetical protein
VSFRKIRNRSDGKTPVQNTRPCAIHVDTKHRHFSSWRQRRRRVHRIVQGYGDLGDVQHALAIRRLEPVLQTSMTMRGPMLILLVRLIKFVRESSHVGKLIAHHAHVGSFAPHLDVRIGCRAPAPSSYKPGRVIAPGVGGNTIRVELPAFIVRILMARRGLAVGRPGASICSVAVDGRIHACRGHRHR